LALKMQNFSWYFCFKRWTVKETRWVNLNRQGGEIMNINKVLRCMVLSTVILAFASIAIADTAYWTDWTGVTAGAPGVVGTLNTGSGTVNVTYTGPYSSAQTSGGTNFWTFPGPTSPYGAYNGPPDSDIIELTIAGTKTITFSQAVQNPLFAFTSWQISSAEFGVPISILSYARGYWGTGTPTLNAAQTGFNGGGEETGVIELLGTFTSITFTDAVNEGWHGFTIGVAPTSSSVPEPATMLLLGLGLIGLAGLGKKS
jgi:hypothetical protein